MPMPRWSGGTTLPGAEISRPLTWIEPVSGTM